MPKSRGRRCEKRARVRALQVSDECWRVTITCIPESVGTRASNRPRRIEGCGAAGLMKFANASPEVMIYEKKCCEGVGGGGGRGGSSVK
jgi:hypothetical protein